jgi:hypothetical protein
LVESQDAIVAEFAAAIDGCTEIFQRQEALVVWAGKPLVRGRADRCTLHESFTIPLFERRLLL